MSFPFGKFFKKKFILHSYIRIFIRISAMHNQYLFYTVVIEIWQSHRMVKVPGLGEKSRAPFPKSFSFRKVIIMVLPQENTNCNKTYICINAK